MLDYDHLLPDLSTVSLPQIHLLPDLSTVSLPQIHLSRSRSTNLHSTSPNLVGPRTKPRAATSATLHHCLCFSPSCCYRGPLKTEPTSSDPTCLNHTTAILRRTQGFTSHTHWPRLANSAPPRPQI